MSILENIPMMDTTSSCIPNISSLQSLDLMETSHSLSSNDHKKRDYDILTPENAINITYLQTYCQSPTWQLEDYFVL
jgi:hypothetical protein